MAQNLKDLLGRLSSGPGGIGTALKLLLGAGAMAYSIHESTFTVEGGHRAIFFNRIGGVQQDTVLAEGLHFRIPWFQYPIIFDVRARPRQLSSPSGSKDLQTVNISLRLLSRPKALELPRMYEQLGLDYEERVLPSIVNEVLKSVVAKFTASQLITQWAQVSLGVRRELTERALDFHLILDDVAITELSFSHEYRAAVEAKQVAQQEAQRAQFLVEKAKQDQRQKIVQAQGEAQAAQMLGAALSKHSGYLQLRRIWAAQNIAKTMAASQNRLYLSSHNLLLNLQDEGFSRACDALVKGQDEVGVPAVHHQGPTCFLDSQDLASPPESCSAPHKAEPIWFSWEQLCCPCVARPGLAWGGPNMLGVSLKLAGPTYCQKFF